MCILCLRRSLVLRTKFCISPAQISEPNPWKWTRWSRNKPLRSARRLVLGLPGQWKRRVGTGPKDPTHFLRTALPSEDWRDVTSHVGSISRVTISLLYILNRSPPTRTTAPGTLGLNTFRAISLFLRNTRLRGILYVILKRAGRWDFWGMEFVRRPNIHWERQRQRLCAGALFSGPEEAPSSWVPSTLCRRWGLGVFVFEMRSERSGREKGTLRTWGRCCGNRTGWRGRSQLAECVCVCGRPGSERGGRKVAPRPLCVRVFRGVWALLRVVFQHRSTMPDPNIQVGSLEPSSALFVLLPIMGV